MPTWLNICRMSITPEVHAKTLTQLVATEIRVQMARADVKQSQLARNLGTNEQWLSVRLRGRQPIDMNDLALIARALGVSVYELLPSPEVADAAALPAGRIIETYRALADLVTHGAIGTIRDAVNRPKGRRDPTGPGRTTRLPRTGLTSLG